MQMEMTSQKPYIVRAFYDWISDNGMTPYILVDATVEGVWVPQSFVSDGQIILNISAGAVGGLAMGGDYIEFNARFGVKPEHLVVPYAAVAAIYSKENGAGTSLAIEEPPAAQEETKSSAPSVVPVSSDTPPNDEPNSGGKKAKGKPSLSVVK